MNTKTMEGLIGAGKNMDLLNTPMRIFKEARRKGDTATMERAMGYANEFTDKAQEYKTRADEGMREEAKEEREKARLEQQETIEKRREERNEKKENIEESTNPADNIVDTVEISQTGKILSQEHCTLPEENTDSLLIIKSTHNMVFSQQEIPASNTIPQPRTMP